jgi:hypothetical protein
MNLIDDDTKIVTLIDLTSGVPSHDSYQRLWNNRYPTQFHASFQEFVKTLQKLLKKVKQPQTHAIIYRLCL